MPTEIPRASGSGAVLLKPETWNAILDLLTGLGIAPDATQFEVTRRGGKTSFRLKQAATQENTTRGTAACAGFRLVKSAANKFTVSESTVGGLTPSGFTSGLQEFTVSTADGVIYAVLTITAAGNPDSATIEQASTLPADTDTEFHRLIGTFHVEGTGETAVLTVTQQHCGPFDALICRNWFAAEAPFYSIAWQ